MKFFFVFFGNFITLLLLDAETVIRNARRGGSRSPKLRKSRSRSSKLDVRRPDDFEPQKSEKRTENPEIEVLTGEIKKLREQIQDRVENDAVVTKIRFFITTYIYIGPKFGFWAKM